MKKHILFFIPLFIIFSCNQEEVAEKIPVEKSISHHHTSVFQDILDENKLKGTILIYDEENNTYYSNNFDRAEKGFIPASTFKIPNTIIGLETGAINEQTIFKWDGEKRFLKTWEEDLTLHQAYHRSCVPCYQELARKVGLDSMNHYLEKMSFGKMEVNSNTIDNFWLKGKSEISPIQMVHFLSKIQNEQLDISEETYKIIKRIMIMKEDGKYTLRGKTGWGKLGEKDLGWFVGIENNEGKVYYIATNVQPNEDFNMADFGRIRLQISKEALSKMDTISKM